MSAASEELIFPTCPACGDPIGHQDSWWQTGDGEIIHNGCNIRKGRLNTWRAARRLMVLDLSFPVAEALGGQAAAEPLVEPIGDDIRTPSEIRAFLLRLQMRLRAASKRNPLKIQMALSAVERNLTRLHDFLGR